MLQFQPVDGFDGFFPVLCFCALKEKSMSTQLIWENIFLLK